MLHDTISSDRPHYAVSGWTACGDNTHGAVCSGRKVVGETRPGWAGALNPSLQVTDQEPGHSLSHGWLPGLGLPQPAWPGLPSCPPAPTARSPGSGCSSPGGVWRVLAAGPTLDGNGSLAMLCQRQLLQGLLSDGLKPGDWPFSVQTVPVTSLTRKLLPLSKKRKTLCVLVRED